MPDVFLERTFAEPVTLEVLKKMMTDSASCLSIYSAEWQQSLLSNDGRKLYCHFQAPDLEAMRNVMRFSNSDYQDIWSCELHDTGAEGEVNVLVERSWDEPVRLEDVAAIEEEGAWCLEAHNVTFLRTFFSEDHKRMICLYRAADAESVRQSQNKANMPYEDVWSFQHLTPALLFPI